VSDSVLYFLISNIFICLMRQIVIAFTYWQRGELVSCKYRSLTKMFFQVHIIQIPFSIADVNNSLELSVTTVLLHTFFFDFPSGKDDTEDLIWS